MDNSFQQTAPGQQPTQNVDPSQNPTVVNGITWTENDIAAFKKIYGSALNPGVYWYDAKSGMFGLQGQASLGYLYPGHEYGTLAQNASNGNTGVLLNGRDITQAEYYFLNQICRTIIPQVNYWMDAYGNTGAVNNPFFVFNIRQLVAQAQQGFFGGGGQGAGGGGGDNFWSTGYSAGNWDGDAGYVSVPGYGPIGYGM
jgi:hypothetical protein